MKIRFMSFFLVGFAAVTAMRIGMLIQENDYFSVAAEELSETKNNKIDKKGIVSPPASRKKEYSLNTIQDRLIKQTKDTAKDEMITEYNEFIFKSDDKKTNINSEGICITHPMLKSAKEYIAYLYQKEKEINEQARIVEIYDRRVREQLSKLKLIKEQVVEQAKLADAKVIKEGKRLISIYEKMKPKAAANIFNEMAPNVAAELLRNMKEDQSSSILAKMSPKMAYNVTLALTKGIKQTERDYQKIK